MTVQKKIKTKQKLLDVINYFKELLFYNTYIKKKQNQTFKKHCFTF